jgi:preprotein translocase subunit YajC
MLTYILLQAPQGGGNPFIGLLFPLLIILVFWFFLIRPQVKRQREGMEVVTSAGIIGKVTKIDGDVVRLLIDERTFIRVLKQTITGEYKPK